MASPINPDPNSSPLESQIVPDELRGAGASEPEPAPPAAAGKFTLPTRARPVNLGLQPEPQVLGEPTPPARQTPLNEAKENEAAVDEAAVAGVRAREAKARLLALRRIEWVAIGLLTVLLGGASWVWRSRSDSIEGHRQAFFGSPSARGLTGSGNQRRLAPHVTPWRAAKPEEIRAASHSIKSQLDAFKRNDYATAATWQSQNLQRRMRTVSAFKRLIQQGYPAFTAYKSVRFGEANAQGDGSLLRIKVALRGAQDEPIEAVYFLVRENGAYHIDGVATPSAREPLDPAPNAPPAETA